MFGCINTTKNYAKVYLMHFIYLFYAFSLNSCFPFSSSFSQYLISTIANIHTLITEWIINTYL